MLMLPLLPHERRLRQAVRRFHPSVRRYLLQVLASPADIRAQVIQRWFEREDTRPFAELLIDLESDRYMALDLMDALKQNR